MSTIGSILTAKELAQTYAPIFLLQFGPFPNSQYLHVATHPLSSRYGGVPSAGSFQYAGIEWLPRCINQNIGPIQGMSDVGVDVPPNVQITLADPDKQIYNNWETIFGFKGIILQVSLIMWDASNFTTGSFSSDSPAPIVFIGTCSAATNVDDRTLSVTATSLLNMTQASFPPTRIQPLCWHNFPYDAAARADGLNNSDSPFFGCSYSPDIAGGVGNYESGTACFTSCSLDRAACIERLGKASAFVPLIQDKSNRPTGNFSGLEYVPVQFLGLQRAYTTGQWDLIINATNEAKWGDYIPLAYGTTWVVPEIVSLYGDGNYNTFEALLCQNEVFSITTAVVNGDIIPDLPGNVAWDIESPGITNTPYNNWWRTINNGGRYGHINTQIGFAPYGDPYGSMAALYVHCLVQLVANSSIPEMQVLLTAGNVRVYTTPTAYTYQYSSNPVWILMDLLIQITWRYSDLDIASFIAAAAVCDQQVYYTQALTGTYSNVYSDGEEYRRYSVGFSLKQRQAIGQTIQGLRNAFRGQVYFNFNTGKLRVSCKQTLADQQPSPVTGSNYSTPVSSVTAANVPSVGYPAYAFDGSNIRKVNGVSTLKIRQKQYAETPNKITQYFFDRENQYNQDISTIIDVEDVNRIGSEISGNFNLIGPQTFDHINRITNTWFAENYRGNNRLDIYGSAIGDTGGTIIAELETTIKAMSLMVGQIVLLSDAQSGLSLQTFRLTKIEPSTNFETCKLTMQFHNDNWYLDSFGQGTGLIYTNPLSKTSGAPRSWSPNYETPQSGDQYYAPTELSFGLAQSYGSDSSGNPSAKMTITGQIPVNSFGTLSQVPINEYLAAGDTGGGYPTSASIFVALSAMAVDGTMSPLSKVSACRLTGAEDAVDVIMDAWPAGATGYFSFAGTDPSLLTFQQSAAVTPATVRLLNAFNVRSWGAPDQSFASLQLSLSEDVHAGVLGAEVVSVTSTTITLSVFTNYGFTTNQWAGREVMVIGVQGSDLSQPTYVPIANFEIASNDADTLTLSSGDPTTCVYGNSLQEGDAVAIRILPTFDQDSNGYYVEDANWVNCLNETETEYQVISATASSPITVGIANNGGTFPFSNGQFVVINGTLGLTGLNGGFVVAAVNTSTWTFQLVGSSGSGTFISGGWAAIQTQGLIPADEVGNFFFIVKGTGRGTFAQIANSAANTNTRLYIVGNWPVAPDSSTRLIVIGAATQTAMLATGMNNSNPSTVQSFDYDVLNQGRKGLFVQIQALSPTGVASSYTNDPFREIFLFGAQAPSTIYASALMLISQSMVDADATAGPIVWTLLPFNQLTARVLTLSKVDGSTNTVTMQTFSGADVFEDQSTAQILYFQGDSITVRIQ